MQLSLKTSHPTNYSFKVTFNNSDQLSLLEFMNFLVINQSVLVFNLCNYSETF